MFGFLRKRRDGSYATQEIDDTALEDAALMGDNNAQALLGAALLTGTGVRQDIDRAIILLKGAAGRGSTFAARSLVHAFLTETYGRLDFEQGMPYLRQSAEDGEPESMYSLGMMMLQGTAYVQQDVIEARSLIRRAAESGYAKAVDMMQTRFKV